MPSEPGRREIDPETSGDEHHCRQQRGGNGGGDKGERDTIELAVTPRQPAAEFPELLRNKAQLRQHTGQQHQHEIEHQREQQQGDHRKSGRAVDEAFVEKDPRRGKPGRNRVSRHRRRRRFEHDGIIRDVLDGVLDAGGDQRPSRHRDDDEKAKRDEQSDSARGDAGLGANVVPRSGGGIRAAPV